jgi:hypothetical protein
MQAEYPANEDGRLCLTCEAVQADPASARLYLCAGCRRQVIVCSCCDRGQIYCRDGCAQQARRCTLQQAGRRYQASRRGRLMHAARMSRWRARQDKVTHHGSPAAPAGDLLVPAAITTAHDAAASTDQPRLSGPHCSWCGRRCQELLRQRFLRRRGRHRDRSR